MAAIHITDIEAAINHWRAKMPSPDGVVLAPAVQALAEVYADLVYRRSTAIDEAQLGAPAMAAWNWGRVRMRCIRGPVSQERWGAVNPACAGRANQAQTARRLRPLARRALITARPPRVFMRTRNPWVRARLIFEGW